MLVPLYGVPVKAGILNTIQTKIPAFAGKAFILFGLLILSACVTTTATLPTSERLELVRIEKQQALANELEIANLKLGAPAFIRVFKYEKTLEAWVENEKTGKYELFKTYPICNFSGTLGPKLAEGDRQAPEGFYEIHANQMNPWSAHHLSFNLGYPNEYDTAHGRTGSNLMIHGGCKSDGCYAMEDTAMEEIYLLTENSIATGHAVPVHIFPFRMTPENMARGEKYVWADFWKNLKEGHDEFETAHIPPRAGQNHFKYVFQKPVFATTLF